MAGPLAGYTSRGFTLVELVTVMIMLGILAVFAMPNLDVARGFDATSFHDRVAASLRFAQKSAVAKRRMVCATVVPASLTLSADASFGAGTCANALAGPDGKNPAATAPSATVTLTAVPAGPLYFQPSGAVTSDTAGKWSTDYTLTVTGETAITVNGATGYVD
jgi:MSHA pilin protein MshC